MQNTPCPGTPDDYEAVHGIKDSTAKVQDILAAAIASGQPAHPDVLLRLQEELETGKKSLAHFVDKTDKTEGAMAVDDASSPSAPSAPSAPVAKSAKTGETPTGKLK